jgi:recombination protein RecA
MFGNPETTPGGRALPYAASVRIDVRKKEDLKDKAGESIGIKVKAKIIKNKMAPPLKVTEFDIYYGKGVDMYGSLLDLGFMAGLFTQKGAWIYYKGEMFSQGRDNAISKLKEDQEVYNQITQELENAS